MTLEVDKMRSTKECGKHLPEGIGDILQDQMVDLENALFDRDARRATVKFLVRDLSRKTLIKRGILRRHYSVPLQAMVLTVCNVSEVHVANDQRIGLYTVESVTRPDDCSIKITTGEGTVLTLTAIEPECELSKGDRDVGHQHLTEALSFARFGKVTTTSSRSKKDDDAGSRDPT